MEFSELRMYGVLGSPYPGSYIAPVPYPLVRHASPLVRRNPPVRLGDAKDGIWENAPVRVRCNETVVTKTKQLWVTSEENKRVYARYIDLLS
jgi:hypothetical protein